MARGNRIVISPDPKGHRVEGVIGAGLTPKPGTVMQLQPATALQGGRHTWEIYNADADGGRPKGPFIILEEDIHIGRTMNDAYAAGERAFGYIPLAGDELNLLIADLPGTGTGAASDHAKGETLIIDDTTGLFIATTGSPETEVAILLEDVNDVLADTHGWCQWTGA